MLLESESNDSFSIFESLPASYVDGAVTSYLGLLFKRAACFSSLERLFGVFPSYSNINSSSTSPAAFTLLASDVWMELFQDENLLAASLNGANLFWAGIPTPEDAFQLLDPETWFAVDYGTPLPEPRAPPLEVVVEI